MFNNIRQITNSTFQFWRKAKSFDTLILPQAFLAIGLIALGRTIIDKLFWEQSLGFTIIFLELMIWSFYVTSACTAIAFMLSRLNPKIDFKQALTAAICSYWVILPVPLFSVIPWEKNWGLGILATIPFFRWIPTFTVERNYLPLGMVIVIPFLLWQTFRFVVYAGQVSKFRAFLTTLLTYLVIYVVYYQWIWAVQTIIIFDKGLIWSQALATAYIAYSFLCQAITFFLTPTLARYFKGNVWLYTAYSGILIAILLFLPQVGFLAVILTPAFP